MNAQILNDEISIGHHIDVGPDHGLITGIGAVQHDENLSIVHWTTIEWRTNEAVIASTIFEDAEPVLDLVVRGTIPGCPEPIQRGWMQ